MIRWLFAALVLSNIGLLMWATWYRDGAGEVTPPRPVFRPEQMLPLNAPGITLHARKTERLQAPLAAAKPRPRCVSIGPFLSSASAERLSGVTNWAPAAVRIGRPVASCSRPIAASLAAASVTVWLRPVASPRWSVGVAWYSGDVLLWYRGLSLSVRPQERFCRSELSIESRRAPGRDDLSLPSDVVVVSCLTAGGPRELAMDPSTVTGFLSWMESAPPGT